MTSAASTYPFPRHVGQVIVSSENVFIREPPFPGKRPDRRIAERRIRTPGTPGPIETPSLPRRVDIVQDSVCHHPNESRVPNAVGHKPEVGVPEDPHELRFLYAQIGFGISSDAFTARISTVSLPRNLFHALIK